MIYLDYAAAAPPFEQVTQQVLRVMEEQFANPGALHAAGGQARKLLQESRKTIAALLGVRDREVFFTSGGTESNNWAVRAGCLGGSGKQIVVSAAEHKSVLEAADAMVQWGYRVTRVAPDSQGRVTPEALEAVLSPDTCMVCVQAVNNETGVLQDVETIAQLAHQYGAAYLCDGVQSFGHTAQPLHKADFISVSAHKLGGPRGVGCLAVRYPHTPRPLLYGGGQELGLRSGTENIPAIAGFAVAAELSVSAQAEEEKRLRKLGDRLLEKLRAAAPEMQLNGAQALRCAGILNCRFPGISGEEMTVLLDLEGICVSPGAACAARDPQPSHVLLSMGLSPDHARESVRFSMGRMTTIEEIDQTAAAVEKIFRSRKNG